MDPRAERAAWSQQRVGQLLLLQQYRTLAAAGSALPSFADVGFSLYSQNDEDGILLFVFALIGFRTRLTVEIAAGDCIECNSTNLIVNHGFTGLLVEASPERCELGRVFYATHPATILRPPHLVSTWVTRDTVDAVIGEHLSAGTEVDLLSLDVDGNDYWILERITGIRPRVVVLEFNALWQAERAVTIPYDPDFRYDPAAPILYCGASLLAFVKLLRPRGYRLVGVERHCFNAFFVREDDAPALLPAVSAEACFRDVVHDVARPVDPQAIQDFAARPWIEV